MWATDLFVRTPPYVRNEVEARVLALQPLAEIDSYLGMLPGTTKWYERLYFSVVDYIENPSYIAHFAIRLNGNEDDLGAIWRHGGYHGGRHVVDAMVLRTPDVPNPENPSEVCAFFSADINAQMMVKSYIAAHQLKVDDRTALRLMRLQAMANTGSGQKKPTRHELAPSFFR
jgi:hypothetical protein